MEWSEKASLSKEVTFNLKGDIGGAELVCSIHFLFIYGKSWNLSIFQGCFTTWVLLSRSTTTS